MEVVPPHTNRGPSIAGQPMCLGERKKVESSCRDEVLAAIAVLSRHDEGAIFNAHEVYAEMVTRKTKYPRNTVFTTMRRMTEVHGR